MRDALARRKTLAHVNERGRDIDHLVEIVAFDHAVRANSARYSASLPVPPYARDRARARFRGAEPVDDQRLAGAQRLLGDARKGRRRS